MTAVDPHTDSVGDAAKDWYRHLFDANPHPMWVYDLESLRFLAVNDAAIAAYGYSREQFLQMSIADIRPQDDVPRLLDNIRSASLDMDHAGVWRHRKQDGSLIDVEIVSHTLDFDGRKAKLVTAHDITNRKHAEQSLAINSEILTAVTESLAAYVERGDWRVAMGRLLRCAISQTQSEYGFIGVVVEGAALRVLAHEGIVWDKAINRDFYEQALRRYEELGYLEFTSFNNLFGSTINTGLPIIANAPDRDPRSSGRPTGHPPMHSFLGVPIFGGKQVHGVVALANRAGGYTESEQHRIETLVQHAGGLCASYRHHEAAKVLEQQRLHAEAARRETEERYRTLFDYASDGIVISDAEGYYLDANASICRMLGYTRNELVGLHAEAIVSTTESQNIVPALTAIQSQTDYHREWQLRRKDGSQFVAEVQATLMPDGNLLGVIRDVTDRKQADDALRKSKASLEAAQARAHIGSWEIDPQTQAGSWSSEMYRIFQRDSALGMPSFAEFLEMVHVEDRSLMMAAYVKTLKSGDSTSLDFRNNTERLALRYFTSTLECIRQVGGRTILLAGTTQDITERKQAEERIRQLNRTYSVLSDINQLIVREREPQTILDQACRIAVDKGEFLLAWIGMVDARTDQMTLTAHADATPDTVEVLNRLLSDPSQGCAFTTRALQTAANATCNDIAHDPMCAGWREAALQRGYRSMASFPLAVHNRCVGTFNLYAARADFFDAEELRLLDELARDIAFALEACEREGERQQAEAARLLLEDQLRQAQKMDAIGQLAGGIAHDFNNLLAAILGNAELAKQDLQNAHPSLTSIEEIVSAGQRAKDLVQRILTFSRPQHQQLRPIQLQFVLEEAVRLLRSTLPAGIDLQFTSAPALPAVRADASQMHQIVINLATNAWHAMENQPGRIDIRLEACRVDSTLCQAHPELQPGPHVRLSVTDSGKGMDAATMDHIFEPFFTTKPTGKGVGLGLSVVHGIVRSHGGAIIVESKLVRGTTFHLYFPASEESADPIDTTTAPAEDIRGHGEHILYLDDEELLVSLTVRFLERLGYRVDGYTRSAEAIAAFTNNPHKYCLVITDYNMPGMSGLEVAQKLMRIQPDVLIVLASGYVRPTDIELANALGICEIILKPNTIEELGPVVHRLLSARTRPASPPASAQHPRIT